MRAVTPALIALVACRGGADLQDTGPEDSRADDSRADDSDPDDSDPDDSDPEPPALTVDVLILGAGPAGLAAAWEAHAAGAEVLVLELEDHAGGAGWYAQNFFGAGTTPQAERGVVDSAEAALAEWPAFTHGGDPDDPWVQAMVRQSAELIDWMVEVQGARVEGVVADAGAGQTPRAHLLSIDGQGPVASLVAAAEDHTWLEHRADALVTADGAVAGARFTDLRTGEAGWIAASAVVVATGGFARADARALADRPELAGLPVVFEHYEGTRGLGHDLLEAVGAAFTPPGGLGVYVHAVPDPREGLDGEALLPMELPRSLIVDLNGQRVADEQEIRSTWMFEVLLAAPDRRLLALLPAQVFEPMGLAVPAYNWARPGAPEILPSGELLNGRGAEQHADAAALAAAWGLPPDALADTLARYDAAAGAGHDADFGKPAELLVPFGADPIYALELVPGLAKAFGGVALDPRARVLGEDGQPIPGLFAAGEVAGMLGTEAVGVGFSGSMTGVVLTGRVAGQEAAALAAGP